MFILTLPPALAVTRLAHSPGRRRQVSEGQDYLERVAAIYASLHGPHIHRVDAAASPEAIHAHLLEITLKALDLPEKGGFGEGSFRDHGGMAPPPVFLAGVAKGWVAGRFLAEGYVRTRIYPSHQVSRLSARWISLTSRSSGVNNIFVRAVNSVGRVSAF